MKVVFFHRKPRPDCNHSVENLFREIRAALPPTVDWEVKQLRYYSEGLFKRIFIMVEAAFSQKGINHVTGDINFVSILLKKRRTVLTVLDIGFMNHPNKFARGLLKWFWITLPCKCSSVITTISTATKIELLKHATVDPEKIKVIYVPILASFVPYPKVFNKANPRILQIGTLPNKNVPRLIEALEGLSCTLDIIGELSEELILELNKRKIVFTSSKNLTNHEVLEKYIEADIISFVSTYEGFGMPIVEANAVGRVVITSNLLSMPEVADESAHFVNPFLVEDIRNGLIKIINDDDYREQLIKKGYQNRLRFDVREIANQYKKIYQQLEESAAN